MTANITHDNRQPHGALCSHQIGLEIDMFMFSEIDYELKGCGSLDVEERVILGLYCVA